MSPQLREKNVTSISDNPGRFAAHERPAAAAALDSIVVALPDGRTATLSPGVLDADARDVFTGGQCAAFALALADATGTDTIGVLVDSEDGERIVHAWIPDPGQVSMELDEDARMLDANGLASLDRYLDGFFANRAGDCYDCDACTADDMDDDYEWMPCEDPTDGQDGLDVRWLLASDIRQVESTPLGRGLPAQSWDAARLFTAPLLDSLGH